jgi:hypothetical protein
VLFRSLATQYAFVPGNSAPIAVSGYYRQAASSVSALTFSLRAGAISGSSGFMVINGYYSAGGQPSGGGVMYSSLRIKEIFV